MYNETSNIMHVIINIICIFYVIVWIWLSIFFGDQNKHIFIMSFVNKNFSLLISFVEKTLLFKTVSMQFKGVIISFFLSMNTRKRKWFPLDKFLFLNPMYKILLIFPLRLASLKIVWLRACIFFVSFHRSVNHMFLDCPLFTWEICV